MHTSNIIQIDQVVLNIFSNIYIYIYTYDNTYIYIGINTYIHMHNYIHIDMYTYIQQLIKKETVNLKNNKEDYVGMFGGRKWKVRNDVIVS